MAVSTIFSTRKGFLYQDRYAVLAYLNHFQQKNVKAFYVDYPLANQKSLDIRIFTFEDKESIYEVKSGEEFKKDKRKNESSEVKDAFKELNDYSRINNLASLNLVISPDLRGKISEYWTHLKDIEGRSSYVGKAKESTAWLYRRLADLNGISSQRDLFNFCKQVSINPSFSDTTDNSEDPYPDIEDAIIRKIDDLASNSHFSCTAGAFHVHSKILMQEMLHEVRKHAGTANNLCDVMENCIAEFFMVRKIVCWTNNPSDPDTEKERIRKEFLNKIKSWLYGSRSRGNTSATRVETNL